MAAEMLLVVACRTTGEPPTRCSPLGRPHRCPSGDARNGCAPAPPEHHSRGNLLRRCGGLDAYPNSVQPDPVQQQRRQVRQQRRRLIHNGHKMINLVGHETCARVNCRGALTQGRRSVAASGGEARCEPADDGGQVGTATPTLRRNETGSTALASVAGLPMWISRWRCGPEEWPEVPTTPMG